LLSAQAKFTRFHWDRQGHSCWVRVSQFWAGQGFGSLFVPRVGQEVIVNFLEGNPDRPIITGGVYNAQNVPPYTLPDEMTTSTIKSNSSPGGGGYNEIRFEDKKGQEELLLHAEKDHTVRVGDKQDVFVGGQRWTRVKGYDNSLVEGNQNEIVDGPGGAVLSVLNKYTVIAGSGVEMRGEQEGVDIQGTGTGVTIHGTDTGVYLKGEGPLGVQIHGVPDATLKADGSVLIHAPEIYIQPGIIMIDGTHVVITAGGCKVTINAQGISVEGGPAIKMTGKSIKLNC